VVAFEAPLNEGPGSIGHWQRRLQAVDSKVLQAHHFVHQQTNEKRLVIEHQDAALLAWHGTAQAEETAQVHHGQ